MDNKVEDELKLECEMRGPMCTRVLQRNPGQSARVLMKRDVWSALRNIQVWHNISTLERVHGSFWLLHKILSMKCT